MSQPAPTAAPSPSSPSTAHLPPASGGATTAESKEKDPQLREKEHQLRETAARALDILFGHVDRAEADITSVSSADQILSRKTLCAAVVDVKKTLEIFPLEETHTPSPAPSGDQILINFRKYMDVSFFEVRAKLRYLRRYIAKPSVDVQKLIVAARMISSMTKRMEHLDDDSRLRRGQSAPDTAATVAAAASASAAAAAHNHQSQQTPPPSPPVATANHHLHLMTSTGSGSSSPLATPGSPASGNLERPLGRSQTITTTGPGSRIVHSSNSNTPGSTTPTPIRPVDRLNSGGGSGSGSSSPLSSSQTGFIPPLNTAAIEARLPASLSSPLPPGNHSSSGRSGAATPSSENSNSGVPQSPTTASANSHGHPSNSNSGSAPNALLGVIIMTGNTTVSSTNLTSAEIATSSPPASPHVANNNNATTTASPLSSLGTNTSSTTSLSKERGGDVGLPPLPAPAVSALLSPTSLSRTRAVSPMPTYTGAGSSSSSSGNTTSSTIPSPPLGLAAFLSPSPRSEPGNTINSSSAGVSSSLDVPANSNNAASNIPTTAVEGGEASSPSIGLNVQASPRSGTGTLTRPKKALPAVPPLLARQDSSGALKPSSSVPNRSGPLSPRSGMPLSPLALSSAAREANSSTAGIDSPRSGPLSPRVEEQTPRSAFFNNSPLAQSSNKVAPAKSGEVLTESSTNANNAPKKSNVYTTDPEDLWTALERDGDKDGVNVVIERTPEGQTLVQGGTLNKLIEKLTSPETPDSTFMKLFLLTHPTILASDLLLSKLFARYQIPPNAKPPTTVHTTSGGVQSVEEWRKAVQTKVCAVLKTWLDTSFEYLTDDMLVRLRAFNQEHFKAAGFSLLSNKIDNLPPALKPPVLPSNDDLQGLRIVGLGAVEDFLEFDDTAIVQQLTLLDFEVFSSIPMKELLSHGWSKTELGWKCPTITMIINRFNVTSNWVAHMILGCETLKHRARMYDKFVQLAKLLRKVNNFTALMAIVAGLNNAALRRLVKTLHEVPRKSMTEFEQLEQLMKSASNYKAYREAIATAIPPCVPYLGVYLSDLTFIEDGNPDFITEHKLINFRKRRLVASILQLLQSYQQIQFPFQREEKLSTMLKSALSQNYDTKKLWARSLEREPKESIASDANSANVSSSKTGTILRSNSSKQFI